MSQLKRVQKKGKFVRPEAEQKCTSHGHPLDEDTRALMEPRFGHNFSRVRVHADEAAAHSALTLNALAYTVDQNIVFGAGQYQPRTNDGKQLIAHELAHVVQQSRGGMHTPSPLPMHSLERAAKNAANVFASGGNIYVEGASAPGIARQPRSLIENLDPTTMSDDDLQREITLIQQWLADNPISSADRDQLVNVLSTLEAEVQKRTTQQQSADGTPSQTDQGQGGAPDTSSTGPNDQGQEGAGGSDSQPTDERPLTSDEIAYAQDVFKDSIDYRPIIITRGRIISYRSDRTIGNTINLQVINFKEGTLELADNGLETLIHEMTHVWQYQNGGWQYVLGSLWDQAKAYITTGDRNNAYVWQDAIKAGTPWEQWGPEQQGQAVEDYNTALRRIKGGTAKKNDDTNDYTTVATLKPYIDQLQSRSGAPHF